MPTSSRSKPQPQPHGSRRRRCRALQATVWLLLVCGGACEESPAGRDGDGGDADGGLAGDLRLDRQLVQVPDLFVSADVLPSSSDRCGGGQALDLAVGATVTVEATTEGANNEFGDAIRCGGLDRLSGPQRYFQLPMEVGQMYRLTVAPQFEAVAYLFSSCAVNVINTDCGSGNTTGAMTAVVPAGGQGSMLFVPGASGTFHLAVDSRRAEERGAFSLEVETFAEPDNAGCATPETLALTDGRLAVEGSTLGARNEFEDRVTCGLGLTFDGPQVYHAVELEQGRWYRLALEADFAAGLYVANVAAGCEANNLEQDCRSITGTVLPPIAAGGAGATLFSPPANGSYLLVVDSVRALEAGSFTLEVEEVAPPGNAVCSAAIPLSLAGGSVATRGDTSAFLNDRGAQMSCGGPPLIGPQAYYTAELASGTSYLMILTTPFDAVLAVGESCVGLPADCLSSGLSGNALAVAGGSSGTLVFAPLRSAVYVIAVEALDVLGTGKFKLEIAEAATPTNGSCSTPTQLSFDSQGTAQVWGDTGPLANDLDGISCGDPAGPWAGPQAYHRIALSAGKTYQVELEPEPSFDPALYAFEATAGCTAASVDSACSGLASDQIGAGVKESLTIAPAADGDYLLVVDSWSLSEVGTFVLRVSTLSY